MIDLLARRRLAELEALLRNLRDPTRLAVLPPLVYLGSPGLGQVLTINPPIDKPRNVAIAADKLTGGKFDGLIQVRDNEAADFANDWPSACWVLDLDGAATLTVGDVYGGFYIGIEAGGPWYMNVIAGAGAPLNSGSWTKLATDPTGTIPAWASGDYVAGSLVTYGGNDWLANVDTSPTDTPGVSAKWRYVVLTVRGPFDGAASYATGDCVQEPRVTYAIRSAVPPSAPEPPPVPTITDPQGGVATGPYFTVSSKSGAALWKASGNNLDIDIGRGPLVQFCVMLCDSNGNAAGCRTIWAYDGGPCATGSGIPGPDFPTWACVLIGLPGSGMPSCGPCPTQKQYCVSYPAFDPATVDAQGCGTFATAGWQTVTQTGIPCSWVWQGTDICAITLSFSGNTMVVQFGNEPYTQNFGRYEADVTDWNCVTSVVLDLTDPTQWPDAPTSIVVWPQACPPPVVSCGPCEDPPTFVCVAFPGVQIASGSCEVCEQLAAGVTLTYATNLGNLGTSCGWIYTFPAGLGCGGSISVNGVPTKAADTPITVQLLWDAAFGLWQLQVYSGAPEANNIVTKTPWLQLYYAATTWDCSSPLVMPIQAGSTQQQDAYCNNFPASVTVYPGPCVPPPGSGSGGQIVGPVWACVLMLPPGSGSGGGSGLCGGTSCIGLEFTGSQWIQSGSEAGLPSGNSPFTLAARFSSNSSSDGYVIFFGDNTAPPGLTYLYTTTGKVAAGNGVTNLIGSTSIVDCICHSICAVFDGTHLHVYVDGVEDATPIAETFGTVLSGFTDVSIGGITVGPPIGGNVPLTADIDDVRIWNVALSAGQVAALAAGDRNTAVGTPVRWYKMGEGAGTTVHDSSSNADHITLGAAPANPTWN